MSGRDLVDDMRSGAKLPRAPGGGVRFADLLLVLAVVIAVGAAGYFGVNAWLGGPHPQGSPPAVAGGPAPGIAKVAWTSADTDRCLAKARAAADAGSSNTAVDGAFMPPNQAIAPGFAGLSTMLECHMSVKTARLCVASERATLVSEINDYLGKIDILLAGMAVEGAPMKVMGTVFGGEAAGGSDMYEAEHDGTVRFMQDYQDKVVVALRKLARDGLLAPADFAGLFGGVPENIKRMFGPAVSERNVCVQS